MREKRIIKLKIVLYSVISLKTSYSNSKNAKTHHDFPSVFAPGEPIAVIRKHTIAHVFRRLSCVLQKHIFIKNCL